MNKFYVAELHKKKYIPYGLYNSNATIIYKSYRFPLHWINLSQMKFPLQLKFDKRKPKDHKNPSLGFDTIYRINNLCDRGCCTQGQPYETQFCRLFIKNNDE